MRSDRLQRPIDLPSLSWVDKWIDTHSVHFITPKTVSYERAAALTQETIEEWFTRIGAEADPASVPSSLTFNMDETQVSASALRVKIIVPRDQKSGMRAVENKQEDTHITLVLCISADGGHVRSTVILPLKEFPTNCDALKDDFCWSGQDKGWITADIFRSWVIQVFIPHVQEIRRSNNFPETQRAILYLDSHSSRQDVQALESLSSANIDAITLIAHGSHGHQALDVHVNGVFKTRFRKYKPNVRMFSPEQRRPAILNAVKRALHEALYIDVIKESFERSGLYPFNMTALLQSPYVTPAGSYLGFEVPKGKKRSRVSISGKVITSDEVKRSLLEASQKDKKKRPKKRQRRTNAANKLVIDLRREGDDVSSEEWREGDD